MPPAIQSPGLCSETGFDSGAQGVCRARPGLLASLLEPAPPPAVGGRTMTKALLVPFLWGVLTPEAVRARCSWCTGRDAAFGNVGFLELGSLRAE